MNLLYPTKPRKLRILVTHFSGSHCKTTSTLVGYPLTLFWKSRVLGISLHFL